MTEVAIREPGAVAVRGSLPVPAMNDIDSWTQIVGQVVKLANEIYDTPFVPDGLRGSAAAVSAAILAGREMGLGPMTSLANIDVIRGKPTQKPVLMRAMILSAGHKWDDVEVNDTRAVVRGCRKGESAWTTVTFTADQAKKAGLNLGNYPGDKLYARASSRLAKRKFSDVIIGIPYTPDDVEDGLDDDELGTVAESGAPAAIEAPKPRTAQRKQRTQSPPSAAAVPPSAAAPSPSAQAAAGGDLPPLPGEEDAPGPADPAPPEAGPGAPGASDAPGTVTTAQLTAIWTVLSQVYHFGPDEKDAARGVCAQILGYHRGEKVELKTSTLLSKRQAGTVIDTLAMWQEQAKAHDEDPRGYLMLMLQTAGDPRDEGEVPGE